MRLKHFNIKKEKNPVVSQAKRNKILLIGLIGLCLLTILIYQTFAIFQLNNEANLTNTKVGEFSNADVKLAIYLDNEKSDTFPGKNDGYLFDRAECSEGATGDWDAGTWSFITSNLTKPTECNIYFKEQTGFTVTYSFDGAGEGTYTDTVGINEYYEIKYISEIIDIIYTGSNTWKSCAGAHPFLFDNAWKDIDTGEFIWESELIEVNRNINLYGTTHCPPP